jgi:hypothetical protein
MAKMTSQSSAIAALKKVSKGAFKDSRNVEAKPGGFSNLPGGIRNGVGRVVSTDLVMSEDKGKGSYPVATIKFVTREPIDYEGVQQTIFFNFHDSEKRSVKDVMDNFCSDLQLLGIDTSSAEDEDNILGLLDDLTEKKPYFLFNTSRGKATKEFPNPTTFVNIQGLAVDYTPPADEPTKEDVAKAAENGQPDPKGPVKSPPKKGVKGPIKPPVEEEVVSEEVVSETPTPDDGWPPAVEDNFYSIVQGEKTVVTVVKVNDQNDIHVRVVDDNHKLNGKVVKKAWADLLGE